MTKTLHRWWLIKMLMVNPKVTTYDFKINLYNKPIVDIKWNNKKYMINLKAGNKIKNIWNK